MRRLLVSFFFVLQAIWVFPENPTCVLWIDKEMTPPGTITALVNCANKDHFQPILRGNLSDAENGNYYKLYLSTSSNAQSVILNNAVQSGNIVIIEKIWGINGEFDKHIGGWVLNLRREQVSSPPE